MEPCIGDLVRRKTGGRRMIVFDREDDGALTCIWTSREHHELAIFAPAELEVVEPSKYQFEWINAIPLASWVNNETNLSAYVLWDTQDFMRRSGIDDFASDPWRNEFDVWSADQVDDYEIYSGEVWRGTPRVLITAGSAKVRGESDPPAP